MDYSEKQNVDICDIYSKNKSLIMIMSNCWRSIRQHRTPVIQVPFDTVVEWSVKYSRNSSDCAIWGQWLPVPQKQKCVAWIHINCNRKLLNTTMAWYMCQVNVVIQTLVSHLWFLICLLAPRHLSFHSGLSYGAKLAHDFTSMTSRLTCASGPEKILINAAVSNPSFVERHKDKI